MAFEEIIPARIVGDDPLGNPLGASRPLDDLPASLKGIPPLSMSDDGSSANTVQRSGSAGSGKNGKERTDNTRGRNKEMYRARSDETDGSGGGEDLRTSDRERLKKEKRRRKKKKSKDRGLRTKYMLESLRSELEELQRENMELRRIVVERLPVKADSIFQQCRPMALAPSSEEEGETDQGGAEGAEDSDREEFAGTDEWAEILSDQLWS
mmetsp:Transcript_394/g.1158  ORF Transcript_394/g.1158 Transcript_394/m.1158 type:complete len:210 (-) Transcript_394:634-1263(-)